MQLVFILQVLQRFVCVREQVSFCGTKLYIIILKGYRQHIRVNAEFDKSALKPGFTQFVLGYFAGMVFGPKLVVIAGIGFNKQRCLRNAYFAKPVNFVQFMQGFFGVFIKIPNSVVEVEENVLVFFDFGYRIFHFGFRVL